MGTSIKSLSIEGFKSIKKLENFELRNLNILIGANGAGKSNFIEIFRLLRAKADENLDTYIARAGGGDGFFFGGPKLTPRIKMRFVFGENPYELNIEPANDGRVVSSDSFRFDVNLLAQGFKINPRSGLAPFVYNSVSKWIVYHFHDTGALSPMRREQAIEDTAYLRPDASNIAAFLRKLRHTDEATYTQIRNTIQLVAPFFDDFLFEERSYENGARKAVLDWKQKGSDFPFQPWHLSDGTLRFICLATALLQPDPPPTIVIDEPELGLHPHALEVLAALLQKASMRAQVIVSTQSVTLLNQFEPEDVITVCREGGASVFGRLNKEELAEWLEDYTLGELWQKNVVEAGAGYD